VTLTATVSSTFGTPPNGEIVTFKSGGVAIGTGTLSGGVATYTTSSLVAANHVLLATYAGDADFVSSQSATITLLVSKYTSTTAMSSTPNPSSSGQAVTLTAHVTTTGPSSPTGLVTFQNGTTTLRNRCGEYQWRRDRDHETDPDRIKSADRDLRRRHDEFGEYFATYHTKRELELSRKMTGM